MEIYIIQDRRSAKCDADPMLVTHLATALDDGKRNKSKSKKATSSKDKNTRKADKKKKTSSSK